MSERALNYIEGAWVWPEQSPIFESRNPADWRQVVATAPGSIAEVVDDAVLAARRALPAWKRTPPPARAELIRRAGEILAREKERLAQLVSLEMGKPIAEGRGDVQEAIDMAHLAAGEGRRLYGETVPSELPDRWCGGPARRPGARVVRRGDDLCRRHFGDADLPRGDLRTRALGDAVR